MQPSRTARAGYTRGATYLSHSGSASWTTNDYAVGLLANTSDDLLDPAAWVILDHHAGTFGPGSAVLVPSPDGTETWNIYHAYDQINCPAWSCRSIPAQKVSWTDSGLPVLAYPVDPFLDAALPAGDRGSTTGWGGITNSANWHYTSASEAETAAEDTAQTFRGTPDLLSWEVSATMERQSSQPGADYGIYPLYQDRSNFVPAFIDPDRRVFGTRASVANEPSAVGESPLPQDFDPLAPHTLRLDKSAS